MQELIISKRNINKILSSVTSEYFTNGLQISELNLLVSKQNSFFAQYNELNYVFIKYWIKMKTIQLSFLITWIKETPTSGKLFFCNRLLKQLKYQCHCYYLSASPVFCTSLHPLLLATYKQELSSNQSVQKKAVSHI